MFGTEHEGFASNPAWYTTAMYKASAGLQRHLCNSAGIAKDRNHIIAHGEKSNSKWVTWMEGQGYSASFVTCNSHTDPGPYWDWATFMSLINPPPPPPAGGPPIQWGPVTHDSSGAMRLFVAGNSGEVFDAWQDVANGSWGNWSSLDSFTLCVPGCVAGFNADGRVECLVSGTDGYVYHDWETSPNGSFVGSWNKLGSFQGWGLTMAANADGRLEVFASSQGGNNVYTAYQGSPNGSWGSWGLLAGTGFAATNLCAMPDGAGKLFLFGVSTANGNVYRCNQATANGSFGSWTNMGFKATQLAIAQNADGHLELFGVDSNGYIGHAWQNPAPSWSGFSTNLNARGNNPVVVPNQDGHLELFYTGHNDSNVWHMWQSAPNGSWPGNGPEMIGSDATSLAAHYNEDGRLEVFWVRSTKDIYHIWQISANSDNWSSGNSMGGSWRGL